MQDDQQYPKRRSPCLDSRVLRHMMHETIDLLDMSTDHADEACMHTDAAMALTRVDWMLMAIFNWLTEQLKNEMSGAGYKPCLLYTSPSPRDRTRSRMPSSA